MSDDDARDDTPESRRAATGKRMPRPAPSVARATTNGRQRPGNPEPPRPAPPLRVIGGGAPKDASAPVPAPTTGDAVVPPAGASDPLRKSYVDQETARASARRAQRWRDSILNRLRPKR